MTPRLAIGITTRNRPDALSVCLGSLEVLRGIQLSVAGKQKMPDVYAHAFWDVDDNVDILGIDSSRAALARARRLGVSVELCDLSFWRPREAKRLNIHVFERAIR